jgi:hypothetical protein
MEQTASFLANPAAAPFCNQGISVWGTAKQLRRLGQLLYPRP